MNVEELAGLSWKSLGEATRQQWSNKADEIQTKAFLSDKGRSYLRDRFVKELNDISKVYDVH
jgi:hypothetical protein